MRKAYIRFGDGLVSTDASPQAITRALADKDARIWLDIFPPDDSDTAILRDVFCFHPLAIEDSVTYTQRPKIEHYDRENDSQHSAGDNGYCFIVFHGPDLETFRQQLRTKEVDIFISPRFLVSVHDEHLRSIDEVQKRFDTDAAQILGDGIDLLLHQILDRITDFYQPILDYLEEELNELEDSALENPKPDILSRISFKKRELLNLRRIIGPQREVLAQLTRGEVNFIRESTRVYFRDVQDHLVRTVEMVELYRDLVMGARDIYLSSISNRLNQIMKTLTIISVIAMPLTVITGFFGMNFDVIPGLHNKWGFWTTVGIMALAVTGMLWLFKNKRWV